MQSSLLAVEAGFHMSEKSQMIRVFTVSQPSQILPANENSKIIVDISDRLEWSATNGKIRSVSIFLARSRVLRLSAIIQDI